MATNNSTSTKHTDISTGRWLLGMAISTLFCVIYYFAPLYMLCAVLGLLWERSLYTYLFAAPLILSILSKPVQSPTLVGKLTAMADYFEYEEAFEFTDDDLRQALKKGNNKYIFAFQPHGVLSLCGMSAAARAPPDLRRIQTAAASALLQTPILKHVMGIFGLVDASKQSLLNKFHNHSGVDACVVLYVGGIAELFKSSRKEERLFLSKRKGFIKLALREKDVDIVPAYLFGNTSVLTVVKNGPLAALSRKLQISLTYFWGKYYLPIPRDDKVLYARGKPLGIPYIENPTDEDVNLWHDKYCKEVARLFDKYKEKVPMYKHKALYID